MSDIAVLLNPAAGAGRALRQKGRLVDMLKAEGLEEEVDYNMFISESEEHLKELATKTSKDYEVIAVAGGDTSYDIVLNRILEEGQDNILGLIGMGTANDITRDFGLFDLGDACSAIKERRTKEVDVGKLTGDKDIPLYFLGSASLGFSVPVNQFVMNLIGKYPDLRKYQIIVGIIGTYFAFRRKQILQTVIVEHDGKSEEFNFSLMVFNNTKHYASNLVLIPEANPHDGMLNACIIETDSFFNTLNTYFDVRKQKHLQRNDFHFLKSDEFNVYSEKGTEIIVDGEILGPYRDINLGVKPAALRVIVKNN